MKNNSIIKKRKDDHLYINSQKDVKSSNTTGLEKFRLVHQALPEINLSDVDTSISVFNKSLSLPLIISSMTGGTKKAYGIRFYLIPRINIILQWGLVRNVLVLKRI